PDDDVLPPAGDAEEPAVVEDPEVAGAEEAVGGERDVERGVEVADAELRAVRLDLPLDTGRDGPSRVVDEPRGAAGGGAAVGAVQLLLRIAGRAAAEDRALGHAVGTIGERAEPFLRRPHELRRDVGGAGAREPD